MHFEKEAEAYYHVMMIVIISGITITSILNCA